MLRFIIWLWLTSLRSKSYITRVMLKSFVILFLLAAVFAGTACQPSTPTLTPTPIPTLAPNELDPSQFLPMLHQTSQSFADFYDAEIQPLHVNIRWFYDPNQSFTLAHTNPSADYKAANITLSHIPKSNEGDAQLKEDTFIVAHELAWLVVGPAVKNGWDLECSDEELLMLADIIFTPRRDHILAKYGFDVKCLFLADLEPFIASPCGESTDPVAENENACKFVWLTLYWQYVLGNHGVPPELDTFCQSCTPNARQEGLNILAVVDRFGGIGNVTSDGAKALLQEIIGRYNFPCRIVTSG